MCEYQGYEFGAGRYPDSYCIDGRIHDADSDHLNDGDVPCPICRPQDAINWWAERNAMFWDDDEDTGDEQGHNRRALDAAASLVNDIRKNRGLAVAA